MRKVELSAVTKDTEVIRGCETDDNVRFLRPDEDNAVIRGLPIDAGQ